MEKLRTKIMDLGLIYDDRIYGKGIHEIIAANLLDSPIGETIVRGVCKGIEALAEEEKKTMQQVIEEILEEDENHLKNI